MFNRALQVKMVKTNAPVEESEETSHVETVAAIGYIIDKTIFKIGAAVCSYVVLDTVRKVIVTKVASQNLHVL